MQSGLEAGASSLDKMRIYYTINNLSDEQKQEFKKKDESAKVDFTRSKREGDKKGGKKDDDDDDDKKEEKKKEGKGRKQFRNRGRGRAKAKTAAEKMASNLGF